MPSCSASKLPLAPPHLQADALDFLGDAANYAISLLIVGMALRYRASARLRHDGPVRAWVIGTVFWHAVHGTLPSAFSMGTVDVAALLANAASFGLLWAYRHGDANMRSAWICTRNDVLGNLAVLLAALGVFGTGTGWPDVIVATIMAGLALQNSILVIHQAAGELRRNGSCRPNKNRPFCVRNYNRTATTRDVARSLSGRGAPLH